MNYEYLRAVLCVYQTGSFSKAAYELFLSQSSVSKYVAKAESELQVKLFDRNGNAVVPTPAGKKLMGDIEQAVKGYDVLLEEAGRLSATGGPTFTISTTPLAPGLHLAELFRQCAREFPSLRLQIQESTKRMSILGLERGEVDMAVTVQTYIDDEPCGPFYITNDTAFRLQPLFRDEFFAVVPKGHPFTALAQVRLEDFAGEDFVSVDESFDSYQAMLKKAFEPRGIALRIVLRASTIQTVLDMVAANVGVSILTKRVANERKDIELIPLDCRLSRETAFVCIDREPLPRVMKWFMDAAKRQAKANGLT